MPLTSSVRLTVVVIREEMDHPWQEYRWRIAGLLPSSENNSDDGWREIKRGDGWIQYCAGTLTLELFRKETEAYQVNLQNKVPVIYAVLREAEQEDETAPLTVHLLTASPFEAQDYLDSGEEIVESFPMPEYLLLWIAAFVDEHHKEEKFIKRKRDEVDLEEHKFGQEPIFVTRSRLNGSNGTRKGGGSDHEQE